MRYVTLLLLSVVPAIGQAASELRGSVVDARGGEPLSNVVIQLTGTQYRGVTDTSGGFRIPTIPSGSYTLSVSTVGYHLLRRPLRLEDGEIKELQLVLSPDTFRQTDTVEARSTPFETVRQDSPAAMLLAANDVKNLGSVLADDPLRSVQSMPGVSSNNDFDARFSLRGASFDRIGLFLDGVLLHEPFHMLQGQQVSGSATAFNGDMVQDLELHQGAWPARFEDRTGGILDVHTRDGSRTGNSFRLAASASNAGPMAEGPLGKGKRGSWLVGARKSYLQYIFERTFPDTSFIFGFEDAQGRLAYDLTSKLNVTLYLLESFSALDRHANASRLGVNSLIGAGYHYTLANFGWRYAPSDRILISGHMAWMREKYDNENPAGLPLAAGFYGEWVSNVNATWIWSGRHPLDAGVSIRRLREGGIANQYQTGAPPRLLDRFDGTALREGGFVQQSWTASRGRLHVAAGIRWDRHSINEVEAMSPQLSAAIALTDSTRVHVGWGQYAQYPGIPALTSPLGARNLLPMRSNQVIAAVERRFGERTRLRLDFYDRADRDLPFQPLYDPRLLDGRVWIPPSNPRYLNSLRGYARGVQLFAQRSSANGVTGWVSYAFGRTGMRDGGAPSGTSRFPADYDQRHTLNVYGGWRIRPTVNLSIHHTYGSGFPIPGYLLKNGTTYQLANVRNQSRMASYSRTDVRVNKSWIRDRWKMTLYGEVVNLTNRGNYVFESFNGYNRVTGQAFVTLDKMFPVLPSVGVVLER